jgi:hypothetical protein
LTTKVKVPKQEADHLRKCLNDLEYYARKHLLIVPKKGTPQKLKFNRAQRIVARKIAEQKREKGYVRVIILKARQEGLSTYTAARFFREANLIPYRKVLIVAHKKLASENLFEMYDRFYKNLDPSIKPGRISTTKGNYLELDNGSILMVETAGDPDAGSSQTVHRLHLSEMAKWPNAEEALTALEETVPFDGGEIIIESTAKGMGNVFHQIWEQASAGESAFMPIFLPWWIHEEYRIKLSKPERDEILATQDPYERKCLDEGFFYDTAWGGDGKVHKLTPEQLAWRRFKIRSKKGNERAFRQENPATPEEAFLSTGDCFFDLDALAILDTKVKPPLYRGFFAEIGPTFHIQRDERGWLRVWEEPNKDRVYAIGADTAYGAQERIGFSEEEDEAKSRTDYSVAWVYDVAARRLVAQLHGKIAPESFARQINWLSYHYGTKTDSGDGGFTFPAKVGIERNHESGVTVIKKLQTEHRHPNLYFSRLVAVKSQGRQTSVCGWHTTKRTRGPMLDELSESVAAWKFDDADELAHKRVYIPDANTLREMRTFILHRSDRTDAIKAAAAEGAHDDRVLALGVTLQVAQTVTKPSPMRVQEPEVYDTPTGVIGYEYRDESYEIADNDEWLWGR